MSSFVPEGVSPLPWAWMTDAHVASVSTERIVCHTNKNEADTYYIARACSLFPRVCEALEALLPRYEEAARVEIDEYGYEAEIEKLQAYLVTLRALLKEARDG